MHLREVCLGDAAKLLPFFRQLDRDTATTRNIDKDAHV
jgi:hypothetical protein